MLKRDKGIIQRSKYFKRQFKIRPFICKKCGNEFWFESCLTAKKPLKCFFKRPINNPYLDYDFYFCTQGEGDHGRQYFYRLKEDKTKFCDICSKDLQYIIDKYAEEEDDDEYVLCSKIGDWLNGKEIDIS